MQQEEGVRSFEETHRAVLAAIDELMVQLPDRGSADFYAYPYVHPQNGQTYRAFDITRNGFTLLAMGFTGARTLEFHARKIDTAHREVIYAGKSMLRWAETAGIHLLKVKEKVQHGEFKAWIEANCECSYDRAMRYMRVAKLSQKVGDLPNFDGGIDAFLEAHSTPRPKTPCPTVTTIDRDDAVHALKLQALVERGTTEAERVVAQRKRHPLPSPETAASVEWARMSHLPTSDSPPDSHALLCSSEAPPIFCLLLP